MFLLILKALKISTYFNVFIDLKYFVYIEVVVTIERK